jgi:flagellar export protein FliJ
VRPFRFALERLLRWRSSETRLARMAHGLAVARATSATEALAAIRAARGRLEGSLAELRDGLPATAGALRVVLGAIERLDADVDRAEAAVEAAEQEVERTRRDVVERRRDERALEAIRRKRLEEHAAQEAAEEAKFVDEVARDRFVRARRGSSKDRSE